VFEVGWTGLAEAQTQPPAPLSQGEEERNAGSSG